MFLIIKTNTILDTYCMNIGLPEKKFKTLYSAKEIVSQKEIFFYSTHGQINFFRKAIL